MGPNAWNKRGFTPLHGAVGLEQPEAVRLLLARGADPHAENYVDGSSLLEMVGEHSGPACGAARKEFEAAGHRVEREGGVHPGVALWTVASMMNHAARPTAARRFVGQMMFMTAGRNLPAGAEITISYSLNPEKLCNMQNS